MKIIYEDDDVLVIDKPAGIVVFPEGESLKSENKTIIDLLLEEFPDLKKAGAKPRYGIIHRLDKDTSGILLVAKTNKALIFLQKQFKNRTVEKKYVALAVGLIKENEGIIETLIGRAPSDKRKQKAYLLNEPASEGKREAITKYKVLSRLQCNRGSSIKSGQRFENYTLLEVKIETGRRHQIRCHLSYIHHPIAGDKMYGFKNQLTPKGLTRQFLHAAYLKIQLPGGEIKEFNSDLPEDLKKILSELTLRITNKSNYE